MVKNIKEGKGMTEQMATGTSVQTGLAGMGKESAQSQMMAESNTAAGQGGSKAGLVDVEAEKRKSASKPLPGQLTMPKPKPRRTRRPKVQDAEIERLKQDKYEAGARIKELENIQHVWSYPKSPKTNGYVEGLTGLCKINSLTI